MMRSATRSAAIAVCLASLAAFLPAPPTLAAPRKEAPPGVVILLADDLGSDLLGTCGEPHLRTPHLDRLAAIGTQFPLAFASAASCSPSRSALLTGSPSHESGQYGNADQKSGFAQHENVETLPQLVKRAGGFVGWIGKRHVAPPESFPVSWTREVDPRDARALGRAAREFFEKTRDKPYLLLVGFTDPHREFELEDPIAGDRSHAYDPNLVSVPRILPDRPGIREDIAKYWRAISRLDQGVGEVLAAMSAAGGENVLVLFTSDNGPPFPGAKTNLTDAGIRVPLLAAHRDQARRGVVCNAMVSHTDVLATALDWMKLSNSAPEGSRGRSLMPILEETTPAGWDEIFASQTFHEITMYYPMRAIRTRTHKLVVNLADALEFPIAEDIGRSQTWRGIVHHDDPRLGDRTLDAYHHRPRVELYDLIRDPHESTNLADSPELAAVRRGLEERLRTWQEDTADPWFVKYSHE